MYLKIKILVGSKINLKRFVFSSVIFFNDLKLDLRAGEEEREICCSTYICIHSLLLACAPTGQQSHNLGIPGGCSKQLSCLSFYSNR